MQYITLFKIQNFVKLTSPSLAIFLSLPTAETDDSNRSFHEMTPSEQEEFFKRIADRLAQIGDQIVSEYHTEGANSVFPESGGSNSSSLPCTTTSSGASAASASLEGNKETLRRKKKHESNQANLV